MSELRDILQTYVGNGSVPGAVGLIARGDRVEVEAAGSADVDGTCPMARDSIFRVASITKPIIAAAVMMMHQPGEAWLYNTCSDIQGVLIARVSGRPLPEFLAERLFEPLGMTDTGFEVPAGKLGRFTSYYRADPAGGLELVDAPGGQWSSRPAFPSGPAAWSRPPTTGTASPGCCWPAGAPAAGGCCRPHRCGR